MRALAAALKRLLPPRFIGMIEIHIYESGIADITIIDANRERQRYEGRRR